MRSALSESVDDVPGVRVVMPEPIVIDPSKVDVVEVDGVVVGFRQRAESARDDGLTEAEGRVMDAACEVFNAYAKLPVQHPNDLQDVADAVHKVQDLLAVRIARRHYPVGWPVKDGTTTSSTPDGSR